MQTNVAPWVSIFVQQFIPTCLLMDDESNFIKKMLQVSLVVTISSQAFPPSHHVHCPLYKRKKKGERERERERERELCKKKEKKEIVPEREYNKSFQIVCSILFKKGYKLVLWWPFIPMLTVPPTMSSPYPAKGKRKRNNPRKKEWRNWDREGWDCFYNLGCR